MPKPTLTELREMATHLLNLAHDELSEYDVEDHDDPDLLAYIESRIAVLQAFLNLLDPTPLTAEHCREAGFRHYEGSGIYFNETRSVFWSPPNEAGRLRAVLETTPPTRGQLRLALMMERE